MTTTELSTPPSLLRRLAAMGYDALLLVAVSIAYGLCYIAVNKWIFRAVEDGASGELFQLGWLATVAGFFCFFWIRGGQTTGMRAWRLQIVNRVGQWPTLGECLLRFALAPLGWLCCFTAFTNSQRLLLHDRWSHTRLVLLAKASNPTIV